MKCPSYNVFFETISNKTRFRIIEVLAEGEKSVNEICKLINEEQSKVSHNLKCLTDCHFIDARKEGKKRIYSLNKNTMVPLMKIVKKHVEKYCCKDCRIEDKK